MSRSCRRGLAILGLILVWIAISACSCSSLFSKAPCKPPQGARAQRVPGENVNRPTANLPVRPSPPSTAKIAATAVKAAATAIPQASAAATTLSSAKDLDKFLKQATAGQSFSVEISEEQLNTFLAGKTFEQEGVKIEDIRITLRSGKITLHLKATSSEMNLSLGLIVRGIPKAIDGQAYLRITDVELDSSVSGFNKLVAKGAIDKLVEEYSTSQGVPLPSENIYYEEIRVTPGKLYIKGHVR